MLAIQSPLGMEPSLIFFLIILTVSIPFIRGIFISKNIAAYPAQEQILHGFSFFSSHFRIASIPLQALSLLTENFDSINYIEIILKTSSSTIKTLLQHFELISYCTI